MLILDTSALISLTECRNATAIARSLASPTVIPKIVLQEFLDGVALGYGDAKELQNLIGYGTFQVVEFSDAGTAVFANLVSGPTAETLDDGESATIALAIQLDGVAVLDERKARKICRQRYPNLQIISTAELLLSDSVRNAIGDRYTEAWTYALRDGQIRVPAEFVDTVVAIVGKDVASQCSCLPVRVRAKLNGRSNS